MFSIRLRFASKARHLGVRAVPLDFDLVLNLSGSTYLGEERDTRLPPVPIIPLLKAEFDKIENWKAELPKANNLLVSLRKLEGPSAALVLHPVGLLRVSQKAVPLDQDIERCNQKPNDASGSTGSSANGLGKAGDRVELFALAQYKNMDDASKLSLAAFQPMNGGVDLSVSGQQLKSSMVVKRVVRYEEVIIDTNFRRHVRRFSEFVFSLFNHFLAGAAVSQSTLSKQYTSKLQPFDAKVKVNFEGYTVAFQSNNRPFTEQATFTSQAAAIDYMQQVIAEDPNRTEDLHVIPQFEVTP
jgi:hypothetical protein